MARIIEPSKFLPVPIYDANNVTPIVPIKGGLPEQMKNNKPDTLTNPLLFVRAPSVGQMRDPLNANWNQALGIAAHNNAAQTDNLNLAELIDFSQMNAIFQNFLEVVGLPQAIIDLEGRVLASSNWQRLCMEFHRANPGTLQRCLESDRTLSREMQEGKPYAIYRCRNGLTDCASPITIEGQHIANLFIGQFLLAPPDPAYFEAQRAEFGFDADAYRAALAEVPIISEDKLPSILNLLTGLAHQIAKQSLSEHRANIAYASIEQQVKERTAQLNASTELLQQVTSHVPGMVYQYRLHTDGRSCLPYASLGIRDVFHVTPEEVQEDASKAFDKIHPDDYPATIASIQASAQNLALWHHEFRVRFDDGKECWLLGHALPQREHDGSTLWHGFITDITERKNTERQIYNLAFFDSLTQLPNRRLLNDRLSQTMAASRRSGRYGALIFLDLDNFKPLNDAHGHSVGDLLLIEVAHRIRACVRETDTVSRFGGDEFVVMLHELDENKSESAAQAGVVAEKIRAKLAEPYLLKVQQEGKAPTTVEHHCTSSLGVVLFINHEASQEDILKWADLAMYQAKEDGRNLIRFYAAHA